jgi:hypothetical protein
MAVAAPVVDIAALDNAIVDEVVRDHQSLRSVGAKYGISHETVRQIVERAGYNLGDVRRAARIPPTRICGVCGRQYPPGQYDQHCRLARHRQLTPTTEKTERNALIVSLFAAPEMYNTAELADAFRVPQPVITRILHRAGIKAVGRRKRHGGLENVVPDHLKGPIRDGDIDTASSK